MSTYCFTIRVDGRRQHIEETMASVERFIRDNVKFDAGYIIDDSGDPEFQSWLRETFPWLTLVAHPERSGLGGCFQSMLETFVASGCDYVFAVEDDTPLIGEIDLADMAAVLQSRSNLAQLMLMRPPFNTEEIAAGGVYAMSPDDYIERTDDVHTWVEHERHFGFQPFLATRDVAQYVLDSATNFLELGVTEPLKAAAFTFGYWGGLNDPPLCSHAGLVRSSGYRW